MLRFSAACHEPHALTLPTHNVLLNNLLMEVPAASALPFQRVFLAPGEVSLGGDVCFPLDALLMLKQVSASHSAVDVAVVGRHACVGPANLWSSPMETVVMVPGYAYRLEWSCVQQDEGLYASWLWHTTAATHALIQQMAQTSYCVKYHNTTQRLASWLVMCLAQYGGTDLRLPLTHFPASIRQVADTFQIAVSALENQGAIVLRDACIQNLNAERLAAAACRCHSMVTHANEVPQPRPL